MKLSVPGNSVLVPCVDVVYRVHPTCETPTDASCVLCVRNFNIWIVWKKKNDICMGVCLYFCSPSPALVFGIHVYESVYFATASGSFGKF